MFVFCFCAGSASSHVLLGFISVVLCVCIGLNLLFHGTNDETLRLSFQTYDRDNSGCASLIHVQLNEMSPSCSTLNFPKLFDLIFSSNLRDIISCKALQTPTTQRKSFYNHYIENDGCKVCAMMWTKLSAVLTSELGEVFCELESLETYFILKLGVNSDDSTVYTQGNHLCTARPKCNTF